MNGIEKIAECKLVRDILRWNQVKLAKAMGISQSVISSVESGLVTPTKQFNDKLSKVKKQYKVKL